MSQPNKVQQPSCNRQTEAQQSLDRPSGAREIILFGVRFFDGTYREIRERLDRGGLMVVPSGPGLAAIRRDKEYHHALRQSDFAIFDSGLLCLALRFIKGVNVRKVSGLLFMRRFLEEVHQQPPGSIFLVDPDPETSSHNRLLFEEWGHTIPPSHQYVAPVYQPGEIQDPGLAEILRELKPKYVIINLGGGVQEILGARLYEDLDYRASIICTGAAISFLTGDQANIPHIVDRLYLGWLARCLSDPKRFVPRYWRALTLVSHVLTAEVTVVEPTPGMDIATQPLLVKTTK